MNTKILRLFMQTAIINFFLFQLLVVIKDDHKIQTVVTPAPTITISSETKISASIEVPTVTRPPETQTPTPKVDIFSELSKHNIQSDCWISYQGHIYNITSFFGNHPGGDTIMVKYCGGDMTNGFDTKEKNPGSLHSATAQGMLSQYLIQ